MVDGVEGQFEAVGNAELVEDIVEVILYGLLADEELFADFAIAEALRDELRRFPFRGRSAAAFRGAGRLRRIS